MSAESIEISVEVPGGQDYCVDIGAGLLEQLPRLLGERGSWHRVAVISDTTVFELYGDRVCEAFDRSGISSERFTFPPGEGSKTRESWARLSDEMLSFGFGRDSVVVALGGGVTGDLAGFVAATYLRGVPVVQVPTSLLAMIDASVGGKTGLDVPAGKNLVGAFHAPLRVVVDPVVIQTLPLAERKRGLAEGVKHGAIRDLGYFEWIGDEYRAILNADVDALERLVEASVRLKASVVAADEREAGLRKILNFGHTLGHALEAASGLTLPHGEAVSIGMVLEARLGEMIGVTATGTSDRLEALLSCIGLPTRPDENLDPETIVALTQTDKKVRGGQVEYVLLSELGAVSEGDGWARAVPASAVLELLDSILAP